MAINFVIFRIYAVSDTWGSETSQYPVEKKANAIPAVVANEPGQAQTSGIAARVVGPNMRWRRLSEASGMLLQRG